MKRLKNIPAYIIGILLVTQTFTYTGCGRTDDETEIYTVTFDAGGGSPKPSAQSVEKGGMATAPSPNPAKTGYVFFYWHLSGANTAYDFQTPVNSNITLYAKWQEETTVEYRQITWILNGGAWPENDNHVTQAVKDGTLAEPNAPVKSGCDFDGWYKESDFINKVTFPCSVTGDLKLYAKWTAESPGNTGDPVVYVAGEEGGSAGVVRVWKNGEKLYALTNGTGYVNVYDMFVDGNDVYVAGDEQNANKKYVAKVWKNGNEYFSFGSGERDSYAKSIYVSGGDVYIAGSEYTSTGKISKVWKNKEELYNLTVNNNDPTISAMLVSGSDVYVCGRAKEYPYSHYKAIVWKNGSRLFTFGPTSTSGTIWSDAYDMKISGNSLYVSGYSGFTSEAIVYRYFTGSGVNSPEYSYQSTGRVNPYAYAYSIDVTGSDVYAVVTSYTDKVYKNSSELYSFDDASIKDIFVKDGDVYLTGTESNVGKVWKNGEELYVITDGTKYAEGSVVFVVNE